MIQKYCLFPCYRRKSCCCRSHSCCRDISCLAFLIPGDKLSSSVIAARHYPLLLFSNLKKTFTGSTYRLGWAWNWYATNGCFTSTLGCWCMIFRIDLLREVALGSLFIPPHWLRPHKVVEGRKWRSPKVWNGFTHSGLAFGGARISVWQNSSHDSNF